MPEKRPVVLLVDDEPDILDSLRFALELDYEVLTATTGAEGLELLESHDAAVIISDQRMPKMTGVEFLERAKELSPDSIRMMLTGFADFDAIVEAINKGHIYRYISKPWEPRDLEMDVRRAAETYALQRSLARRMRELGTLCEIGASITSVLDREEVIQKILDGVIEALGFDRCFLLLVDEEAGLLRSRKAAGLTGEALTYFSQMEYELSRDDVAVVLTVKENRPILVEDVDDPPVSLDPEAVRRIGIRSFVTAPLRAGGQRIGVLFADRSGAGERVTEHDQRLLMGFGDQAAIALENARLYGEALEKQRLEEEVAVAARIQQHLLPATIPEVDGFEVCGTSRLSRGVSGDYFDVIEVGDGRVWVALGDVCGKGIQAGLTMATLRTLFRSEIERDQTLGEAMRRVGEGLWRSTAPEVFATFCFGIVDPKARTFTFVNAGHPFPMLAGADGGVTEIEGASLPVGMDPNLMPGLVYEEKQVEFSPGDVLAIYSDGVTEAGVGGEDMFGEERLSSVVAEHRADGALKVQEAICEAVDAFVDGEAMDDDLTLVIIAAKR